MSTAKMSRRSEIIFHFLDVNRDDLLTWEEMMTFPKYLQSTKGKEDLGVKLAELYRGVWNRINEAIGNPKTADSLTLKDFITGTDIVRQTTWFQETFVKGTTNIYFDSIDRNRDDVISLEEWRQLYAARSLVDDAVTKETFDKLDTNGNGVISRSEFVDAFEKFSVSEEDFGFLYDINKVTGPK